MKEPDIQAVKGQSGQKQLAEIRETADAEVAGVLQAFIKPLQSFAEL